ncbi:hypothetical protein Kpho02_39970 [Kitasatospora phosalacinea]|uniref:Uncharacterized protein n=1 Tax=Kitasatospora phosalacinea TaxID=2065 RepID=A0A9W6QAY3_9ACTN|nr:hypothetical protein Kpho02_39970 [Kitasatospora phosalacinea]
MRAQQVRQAVPQARVAVTAVVVAAVVVAVAVIVLLAVVAVIVTVAVAVIVTVVAVIVTVAVAVIVTVVAVVVVPVLPVVARGVGRVPVLRAPIRGGSFRSGGGAAGRVVVVVGLAAGELRPVRCVMVVMPVARDSPVEVSPVAVPAFTHAAYSGTPTPLQPLPMYHL